MGNRAIGAQEKFYKETNMNKDFGKKDFLPIWCEQCNVQGYIFVEDAEIPAFLICKKCGYEASQVWCPTCGMGGDFIKDIKKRPTFWYCSKCRTKYQLPSTFYDNPVTIHPESDLPEGSHIPEISNPKEVT